MQFLSLSWAHVLGKGAQLSVVQTPKGEQEPVVGTVTQQVHAPLISLPGLFSGDIVSGFKG